MKLNATLNTVRIFTRDWARARRFYAETLGLEETFADEDLGWAAYDVGGPSLGLERVAPDDEEGQALSGRFLGISLEVADIGATVDRLRGRGVQFHGDPALQPWGGVLAHFDDPDGNTLTLLGRPSES